MPVRIYMYPYKKQKNRKYFTDLNKMRKKTSARKPRLRKLMLIYMFFLFFFFFGSMGISQRNKKSLLFFLVEWYALSFSLRESQVLSYSLVTSTHPQKHTHAYSMKKKKKKRGKMLKRELHSKVKLFLELKKFFFFNI